MLGWRSALFIDLLKSEVFVPIILRWYEDWGKKRPLPLGAWTVTDSRVRGYWVEEWGGCLGWRRFASSRIRIFGTDVENGNALLDTVRTKSEFLSGHTHTHARAHTHTHIRAHAHTHTYTHAHTHTHTHAHAHTHTHTHTHTHGYTHYPSSYGLNSITTGLLKRWLWH